MSSKSEPRTGERRTVVTLASDAADEQDPHARDTGGPNRPRTRRRLRAVRVGVQRTGARVGALAFEGDHVEDIAMVALGGGVMMGRRANGLRVGLVTPAWHPASRVLLIEEDGGMLRVAAEGLPPERSGDTDRWPKQAQRLDLDVDVSFGVSRKTTAEGARPRSGTRLTRPALAALQPAAIERAERDKRWALDWVRRLLGDRGGRDRD